MFDTHPNIFNKVLLIISLLLIANCSKEDISKAFSPLYPNKSATHIVELYKIQISDRDFNISSFGNPLRIELKILENGNKIARKTISGKRGERFLNKPIQWIINFNPKNNYQIVISELAVIAGTYIYRIPATPKIGMWPFTIKNGEINFGTDSKLFFRDKIAK